MKNVSSVGGFAWGADTLAYLYRSLGQASRVDVKELSGLDIPVFSYVCTSGESGSEVVKTSHPEGVHGEECVHKGILAGGTILSAYVYMDQYPCYTSISVHR
ncbi:hypothetical protein M9H77_04342 [Catharanthus roseus]|uniref:Uncharacterized protein n=1 Tax=Catharanthus roseus TaxID=4058 RepID=A0ACC0CE98_CATRO|nr:hypothetical protein M9H77_04342 [Catharanthus roseus]